MATVAVLVAADDAVETLSDAVYFGDKNTVERLLASGVRPNDASQITDEGYTPLHLAVGEERLDIAELLLRAGAELEAKDSQGRTPLHRATLIGAVEGTKWLLGQGADLLATDKEGKTPIDLAIAHNYEPVIEAIQQYIESI